MATRGEHSYIHHTFSGAPAGGLNQTDNQANTSTPRPSRTGQDRTRTHTPRPAFLLFLRLLCLHSSASAMVRSLPRSEADGERIGKSREIRNEQRSAPQQVAAVAMDNSGATLRARLARGASSIMVGGQKEE